MMPDGDVLQQKGYYDAIIDHFEQIRDKRGTANEEVTELERQVRALQQKIDVLTGQVNELDASITSNIRERDVCTEFLTDLLAGGLAAKKAMMRLARGAMSTEDRVKAMREDVRFGLPDAGEPMSPKLGSSKKMHHEAVQVNDFEFMQMGGRPPLTVRCYSGALPGTDSSAADGLPVLVYFHGEGYVAGDLETHDWLCRSLAAMSRLTVAAVDYRRAPEERFPTAFEDSYAALTWVAHGGLGYTPSRLGVGGDSAGGGLAVACCLRARDDPLGPKVHLQVLFYPWLDLRPDAPCLTAESADGGLTQDNLFWYRHLYTPEDPPPKASSGSQAGSEPGSKPASQASSKRPSLTSQLRPGSELGSKPGSRPGSKPASARPPSVPSRVTSKQSANAAGSRAPSAGVPAGSEAAGSTAGGEAAGSAAGSAAAGSAAGDGSARGEDEEKLEVVEEEVEWFMDPRASPILAASLAGLPRAFVAYAEDDPVSLDAIAYAERLSEEGSGPEAVHTLHFEGPCGHGFAKLQASPEARSALSAAAAFASAALRA
mmetsp:Transcript_77230/g.244003  ORF Transcript_77230/g.244003 Transcript_77230/m.244003 type:complete len:543 (+) Transcript_77230:32-1660(+)